MKKKKWLSMLLSTTMVLGSMSIPAAAAENEPAEIPVNEITERAVTDENEGRTVNFNKDWKFALNEQSGAQEKAYDDAAWEAVDIPHDFSITQEFSNEYEAESGFLPGGIGWYRKTTTFPADYAGKNIVLNFDGVYNYADVYVNGTKVGENRYGYSSFAFDITNLVTCDGTTENVIAVRAENKIPSSRWYSGSGIYRDVTLEVTGNVHVALDGTYVTTPDLEANKNSNAKVNVVTTVENDTDASVTAKVRTTVIDADGNAVSTAATNDVTVAKDAEEDVTQETTVSRPKLWDCDNPNLYYVKTEILVNDEVTDTYMTEFGFRYIKYDANTGFSLNGKNTKLKGVCMHHDQGALGAAAYYDAMYRQVEILKEMGCNAIRTSHNSPAGDLLKICNELGMLVQDEVFDGWAYPKNGNSNDFSVYFKKTLGTGNNVIGGTADETWAQFALESTLNRDKNAPCVVMWSIGNELPTGAEGYMTSINAEYPGIADQLIGWMKGIDDTKPITMGDNNGTFNESDFRTTIDAKLAAAGGVVGLNYHPQNYVSSHGKQPKWPLVATETASPFNSRGIYSIDKQKASPGDYQCTAYDTHSAGWGNTARSAWWGIITNDFMSGEFIWTGFDYIGEPTPWNGTGKGSASGDVKAVPNSSYFGVIDTAGFPKDSFYYYTSQWREDKTTLHVVPQSWNEEDLMVSGGKVPVSIYSNAATVELYLNGTLVGTSTRKEVPTPAGHKYATYTNKSENTDLCDAVAATGNVAMAAEYKVAYQAGTLSAKAYDDKGNEITDLLGLTSVTTNSDEGSAMKMTAEKTEIQADGSSLCYISVDVVDKDGRFVSAARNNIRFNLTGNGTIVGVDNGNPSTVDKFQQKSVLTSDTTANIDAFSGKALVIVRSTDAAGGFSVKATSANLGTAKVDVNTVNGKETKIYVKDYDLTSSYNVEMGTAPALQTSISLTMSDGTKKTGSIEWQTVGEEIYNTPGSYTITGTMKVDADTIAVQADVNVAAKIVAVQNYSRATSTGVIPKLPDTVSGILPDGRVYDGNYKVTWDKITEDQVQTVGTIVTVKGTVEIAAGVTLPITATVRVAEGVTLEAKNAARDNHMISLTENCSPASDNLQAIINGKYEGNDPNLRWTNWDSSLLNDAPAITFTWDEVQLLDHVDMYYYKDGKVSVPKQPITLRISADGQVYETVSATPSESTAINANCEMIRYQFANSQKAMGMTAIFSPGSDRYVGLTECEIWTTTEGYEVNSTALLDTLTIDGQTPQGFEAGKFNAEASKAEAENRTPVIEATASDNASVTVVPMDSKDTVRVIVQSEDRSVTNVYTVQVNVKVDPAVEQAQKDLKAAVSDAETVLAKGQGNYTDATWAALQQAVAAAKAAGTNATAQELNALLAKVKEAKDGLKENASTPISEQLKLDAPTIKSVKSKLTKKASTVIITVNAVAKAENYTVYRKNGSVVTEVGTTAAGKLTVTDQNPVSGKKVGYYAVAKAKDAKSLDGSVKYITLPKATSKVTARKAGAAVRINWKKVSKATKYYVFRSEKKASGYVKVAKTTSGKRYYLDKKVKKGKKYFYKVVTQNKAGYSNLSKASKGIKVTK